MKKTSKMGKWFLMMVLSLALTACGKSELTQTTVESDTVDITESVETSASQPASETQPAIETQPETEEVILDGGEPSQVLSGDWNEDGKEDTVELYWEELEGSIYVTCLQLQISGTQDPCVVQLDREYRLAEIQNGDLDGDGQQEIVIIFDALGNGANGAYGLILLDHIENEWISVTGKMVFSGFTYQVTYEESTGSYLVTNAESGKEYRLHWDEALQDPANVSGRVTQFYNWTIVKGTEQDYLELWQYVAGEFTMDHVGDMVTTIALQDGAIQLKDEMAVQETWSLCKTKKTGDHLEIIPVEHVYDGDTKRLEELKHAGWDLEKLYHDDMLRYYEIPYEEEKITALLTDATRYYQRFDENHMIRVEEEEMGFVDDDLSRSGRYWVFLDREQVVCIMWDPRQ